MYIFKNAWISIIRNKGRNLLIGAIILVIACCCTITLAINNTASDLIKSYDSSYAKELTISFNRESMRESFDFSDRESMEEAKDAFSQKESYTIEDVKNFAESDYIESYYYTYSLSLNGNNIDQVTFENDDEDSSSSPNKNFGSGTGGRNGMGNMKMNSLDFTLTGYSSIDSMNEFISGTYTIVDIKDDAWDIAFNGNYVFINEELASYNELEIGDTIKLEDEDETEVYEFEIIGIFKDNSSDEGSMMSMFSNSANTIVTNSDTLVSIDENSDSIEGTVTSTFIIDDYDNAEIIQEEFYEKGLDEAYSVSTNQEVAESGLSSVKNVKSFATTFLAITLLIGGEGGKNIPDFNKISNTPAVQAYESIDAVVNINVIIQLLGLGLILILISSMSAMVSIQRFSPLTILKERS